MNRIIKHLSGLALALLIIHAFCLLLPEADARAAGADSAPGDVATVDVDAAKVTGKASPYIFGQNMEHEHGTISGGEQRSRQCTRPAQRRPVGGDASGPQA